MFPTQLTYPKVDHMYKSTNTWAFDQKQKNVNILFIILYMIMSCENLYME